MGEKRNAYRLLVGKPEERRPLGRPRRRWLDNIRMDLVEVGCEMLRIPHCLDSRLTDGGKVVSPTHRPRSTPQKHFFFCFCYLFLSETE
jgi:hypothetical protein